MKLANLWYVAMATVLVACGGGGGSASPSPPTAVPASVSTQAVSGTLTIGNPGSTTTSNVRHPAFVSISTKHVALFIDGAASAAGQTTTCASAAGTGTGCTITWAAQLTVPAAHTFAVEADAGAVGRIPYAVLSVGSGSYAIVAGSANTLTALSLNGIAASGGLDVGGGCAGVSPNSQCQGIIQIADASAAVVKYSGATVVPTVGNSPSSGNVFDNGPVIFVSSAPAVGAITGGAVATFSSLASGTLTFSGVNTTGAYPYTVTCVGGANGTFGLTAGGANALDSVVTTGELAGLSPAVSLPAPGLTIIGTQPMFTCTAGNITSAGGTLIVN